MDKMDFEYKVTVIIPVYNVEQYLPACLNSLLVQTMPQEQMEVLMINDGSPDGSLAICERYAAEHENFKVISQENQGVSAARNTGIRNAKGKYLLYLDGDDTLSPETVKNVTDFFDNHYDEVDVVGYPILFCYENGERRPHGRDKILKATGIYDTEETLHINLTTINAIVKNKGEENFFFDETLFYHEDEAYLTDAVMNCGKMGYVCEAAYFYFKRGGGISEKKVSPYYIFEPTMMLYEKMFKKHQFGGKVSKYVQAMVLNDFGWKIRSDAILPYHYSEKDFLQAKSRISSLLDLIDTELILGHPSMNEAHKYFLLSLKTENRPFFETQRNHQSRTDEILLLDQNGQIRRSDNILIVLEQCKIEEGSFYMLAYLKEYAFSFTDKPQLFAVIDGKNYIEVPLYLSQQSCYWSKMRTNTFLGFSFELTLDEFSSLQFVVRIAGKEFRTKYWAGDRQSIQPNRKRNYLSDVHKTVFLTKDRFEVVSNTESTAIQAKKDYEKYLFRNRKKQWLVRLYARKRPGRIIWLYEDTYNAVDNAYYQFLHDFDKKDGIERYYVCDKASIDWQSLFTPDQQKCLVQRMGKKHKRLFIQADKILTSFIGHDDFVPFDRDTILYYWDLFHFEVTYLQHGVMHAELSYMYSKEKIYMVDKVVASTYFEKENLINKLAFREKDILCTGMPRLDRLEKGKKQQKILFAPSWRSYLVASDAQGRRIAQANFEKTDYFQEIRAFLTDEHLVKLLEENKYVLEIKLHPNFQAYFETFKALCDGKNMSIVEKVDLGEYAAFFTDFTSFMYDCFYLDIPVITHIFDYGRFKAGLHTYRDLCWPMEEEYPFYCKEIDDVIQMMEQVMQNNETLSEIFKQYTKGVFFSRDQGHAGRLYDCLIGEKAGRQDFGGVV